MTRRRKGILAVLIILIAAGYLLPSAREQLAWWWAQSCDRSTDYAEYLADWPKGRHAALAQVDYAQRSWAETKKAMILEAYRQASNTNASGDADYRKVERLRREEFYWKQVTNEATIDGYHGYLLQYPRGKHALEARRQLAALSHQGGSAPAAPH